MKRYLLLCTVLLWSAAALAGTVVLSQSWIDQNKKRATIKAGFIVDHAHKKPNPPAKDGDMHVAGRSPKDVGLPMVAEVMNAAGDGKPAADKVHQVEGTGNSVSVVGAWRLWFEHPGAKQTQFKPVPVPGNTNPDHCFEIHPLVSIENVAVGNSFHDIVGFKKKSASDAFEEYEKQSITVFANDSAVALTANKIGFNYVDFWFEALGNPTKLQDNGLAILANVGAEEGDEVLAKQIPMIFVPNTLPWQAVKDQKLGQSDRLHVIGIPRINLNAISAFAAKNRGTQVKRKLPYEMIVVAVFK
jgi:hypothetical protein